MKVGMKNRCFLTWSVWQSVHLLFLRELHLNPLYRWVVALHLLHYLLDETHVIWNKNALDLQSLKDHQISYPLETPVD